AKRLHAVLADLESQRRGDVIDTLLDQLAHAAQQLRARIYGGALPRRPGIVRGTQRVIRATDVRRGELTQHLSVTGWIALGQRLRCQTLLTRDVQWMPRAQRAADA